MKLHRAKTELKNKTLANLTVEMESLLPALGYSNAQEDVLTIATEYMSTMNVQYNQYNTANYTNPNNTGY